MLLAFVEAETIYPRTISGSGLFSERPQFSAAAAAGKWWDPATFEASKTTYLAYMKSQARNKGFEHFQLLTLGLMGLGVFSLKRCSTSG